MVGAGDSCQEHVLVGEIRPGPPRRYPPAPEACLESPAGAYRALRLDSCAWLTI
jgi:hypothetical protein